MDILSCGPQEEPYKENAEKHREFTALDIGDCIINELTLNGKSLGNTEYLTNLQYDVSEDGLGK